VLEQEHGLLPPKAMHPEIGHAIQVFADEVAREVSSSEVYDVFQKVFVNAPGPYELIGYWPRPDDTNPTLIHGELRMKVNGEEKRVAADGNGPISAFVMGLRQLGISDFNVENYHEQAVGKGADAVAVAYVPLKFNDNGALYGVGTGTNIDQAAIRAIVAGLNRRAVEKKLEG
jgi:2-isopropylmalate synthase